MSCSVVADTREYLAALRFFAKGGAYKACPYFHRPERLQAQVHVFSLGLMLFLWDKPHYRNGTFQTDMLKNLRNVGIPGLGIPLSYFCVHKWVALFFFFFLYPLLCFLAASLRVGTFWLLGLPVWRRGRTVARETRTLSELYRSYLLEPQDWFNFWRLNCCLASYHSLITGASGYQFEDKWEFMKQGKEKGLPVSSWLELPEIIVKDKNEEGGMGVKFFKNAVVGGDWIFQQRIQNSETISRLLPKNAPLSTCRVITASRGGLTPSSPRSAGSAHQVVKALSCVFRAGLENAATDHQSILFDVDKSTGVIGVGTTNRHWYQLGLTRALPTLPGLLSSFPVAVSNHPDSGVAISGETIGDIKDILDSVVEGHYKLLPDVPLVGWDVALTPQGIQFVEINLSCNFFKGTFDQNWYFRFYDEYFRFLDTTQKESSSLDRKKSVK